MRTILLLLSLLCGCPELQTSQISEKCTKQYEKCKLPSGPLGVCDSVPCPEGAPAEKQCLRCMPQH